MMMDQNALLIAQAILYLKQSPDVFKDYVLPISTAFFSAFAGGVSAYYFNRRQDKNKDEKENFKTANKIFLTMLSAQSALKALKSNYCHITERHPVRRALMIQPIVFNEKKIDFDISKLSFIKDIPTANKTMREKLTTKINQKLLRKKTVHPSSLEIETSWRNLKRLNTCIANYNVLIDLFKSRASLDEKLREELIKISINKNDVTVFNQITSTIDQKLLQNYLYETELILVLIDHFIVEVESFSEKFPLIAESNIELSCVGRGVKLLRTIPNEQFNDKVLSRIIPADYFLFSLYTGIPIHKLHDMFTFYGGD